MFVKKVGLQPGRMIAKACNSLPLFSLHTSVTSWLQPTCLNLQATRTSYENAEPLINSNPSETNMMFIEKKEEKKVEFYRRRLPDTCISFSSAEGKQIFKESLLSGHLDCYFPLASQFRTQEEPAFCGLSTLVMVLNTLEVDPKKVWKGPWRWYHENMLDCCIPLHVVEKTGIMMEQFSCLAACNMLKVKMTRVDANASEETFRQMIKSVTRRTDQVLVVSYSRVALGQTGGGHFSPIGGYNAERDMVLIMDTARFKYPPHWVSLPVIFLAMNDIDPTSGMERGYFLLSKNQYNPGLLFRLSPFFSPLGPHSRLADFFKSWVELLSTDIVSTDLTGSEVAEIAVAKIISMLGSLEADVYLITTQLDTKYAEAISYKRYLSSLFQLISNLENLPFFSILTSKASNAPKTDLRHAGSASLTDLHGECPELQELERSIKPEHFLATFMLSWPYKDCRRFSISSNLHKYFASQLARPDAKYLQNECARIRQQLSSLVGYSKQCHDLCCT